MVSSSRKKNKGKDRKAKKVQIEKENAHTLWKGLATSTVIENSVYRGVKTITCNHGCGELPRDLDHPVSSFMKDFTNHWSQAKAGTSILEIITPQFQTHRQVLNDESYREMVVKIMIRIGTNMLLSKELCDGDTVGQALTLAKVIAILEYYDDGMDSFETINRSRKVATKKRDLDTTVSSGRRDALKFYSKRTACSCLKGMHQEARKSIAKRGRCHHCMKEKERVALSVCSKCMIAQYCSKDCQVASLPRHKSNCDVFFTTHKQQVVEKNAV